MSETPVEQRVTTLETQVGYVLPRIEKEIDRLQLIMNEQFEVVRTAIHDIEREDRYATCPKKTEIAATSKGLFEVREEIERVEAKLDAHIAEPAVAALEQKKDERKTVRNLVLSFAVGALLVKGQDIIRAIMGGKIGRAHV